MSDELERSNTFSLCAKTLNLTHDNSLHYGYDTADKQINCLCKELSLICIKINQVRQSKECVHMN